MSITSSLAWGVVACAVTNGLGLRADAQEAPSADSCDIFGITLGMSAAEAIKALKEKFGPMAAIKPQASPSTFGYGSYSKRLNYTLGNMTINIQFVEYMPLDREHREAAWAIEYKLEKPTRAEHAAFNAALQAKYGPVSSFADPFTPRGLYPGLLMHWRQCPHLESGPNNLDLLNRDYIAWEGSFSVPTRQGRLPP